MGLSYSFDTLGFAEAIWVAAHLSYYFSRCGKSLVFINHKDKIIQVNHNSGAVAHTGNSSSWEGKYKGGGAAASANKTYFIS